MEGQRRAGREEWKRWGKEGVSVGWSRSEGVRGSDKENYKIIGLKA